MCIEGSGPAKLLSFGPFSKLLEIANMETARIADAPVIFVTDNLDSIPGALSYLREKERERVKGVILNKFRTNELLGRGNKRKIYKTWNRKSRISLSKRLEKDIMGVILYLPELAELLDLDPLVPSPKVPFDILEKR